MFYSGWEVVAPTCMDVNALSVDMRRSSASGDAAAAYVTMLPLRVPTSPAISKATAPTRADSTRPVEAVKFDEARTLHEGGIGGSAARGAGAGQRSSESHSSSSHNAASPPTATLPSAAAPTKPRGPGDRSSQGAGCVLRLAPRPALSLTEMERQLIRRAAGATDSFHVKSNLPILVQTGVLLMECVVEPQVESSGVVGEGDNSPDARGAAGSGTRPAMPELVVGVSQRLLPWYSLPGDADRSIGFYAAQRHVVKHGGEDRDSIMVPTDVAGSGAGRISPGDTVGCLVDLIQRTLSFTVNRHVVCVHAMDASCDDGTFFFAVGLARRPQRATDISVRFFTGAECRRGVDGADISGTLHQNGASAPPRFPLSTYVRRLALQAIRRRRGDGRSSTGAASASAAAAGSGALDVKGEAATTALEVDDFMSALSSAGGGQQTEAKLAAATPFASLSASALRDVRTAAVLREYLAVRGMSATLEALDVELASLAPSCARVCTSTVAPSAADALGGKQSQSSSFDSAPMALGTSPHEHVAARGHSLSSFSGEEAGGSLTETGTAWRAYASGMGQLRRLLLTQVSLTTAAAMEEDGGRRSGEAEKPLTNGAPPLQPSLMEALLGSTLWKPSLLWLFASQFLGEDSGNAGFTRGATSTTSATTGGKNIASGTAAPRRGRSVSPVLAGLGDEAPRHGRRTPLTHYGWCHRHLDNALLTVSFLALRQDIRFLLRAHQLVEELWALLRRHIATARETCETMVQATDSAGVGQGAQWLSSFPNAADSSVTPHGAPPLTSTPASSFTATSTVRRPFAVSEEAEQKEMAAFSEYVHHTLWDPNTTLPPAMAHLHRSSPTPAASSPSKSAGGNGAAPTPTPLHAASITMLAALAGQSAPAPSRASATLSMVAAEESPATGAAKFRAALETYIAAGTSTTTPSCRLSLFATSLPAKRTPAVTAVARTMLARSGTVVAKSACQRAAVEEAVLLLYRNGLLPAPAPPPSAQARLAQTLCSLLMHICGTIRQLDHYVRVGGEQEEEEEEEGVMGNATQTRARVALRALDLLSALLEAVEVRNRQQVWCRLTHALEDMNCQLEAQLRVWGESLKGERGASGVSSRSPLRSSPPPPFPLSGRAATARQRSHEPIHPSSQPLSGAEGDTEPGDQLTSASLTASFSSLRGAGVKDVLSEDGQGEEYAVSYRSPSPVTPTPRDDDPCGGAHSFYESLTGSLPSLRLLWRRVAARAALEPARHLVTDLFVQELRRSLQLAPPSRWGDRAPEVPEQEGTRHASATPVTTARQTLSVKRPLPVSDDGDCVEDSIGLRARSTTLGPKAVLNGASTQDAAEPLWFTEELYLSSVYMKRVLRHLSSH